MGRYSDQGVFKFWEISDYIPETVQDRDIVAMEDILYVDIKWHQCQ